MDIWDVFLELLQHLNFRSGFSDIQKRTKNPFIRAALYILNVLGILLFAAVLAGIIFLLGELVGLLLEFII